ncbi:hypothetical protein [Oceanospirillum linum]|uniref:Uncharacterized protein n=1 Tax=Oceanospirillum linum TaxID=966 RepID=A0A1T1H8P0_OCELI|nr:hypothetical protein [Oceanospirillum linum]OOV86198.1 hypothetical protein BTA35_0214560 [Oceanospirillum linum]SEG38396.1 hypothetical protein SAMN04489856_10970 [Oleiphilus messinensis]SMP32116.1 hypothetical protein SAMN06264348_10959 [Oceanospirillum linum]
MPNPEQKPNLYWFTETTIPDYTNKAVEIGFAVGAITRMLDNDDLSDRDKRGLHRALTRLSESLIDLSEEVEDRRYDFDEQLRQHLKPAQKGGFRHA